MTTNDSREGAKAQRLILLAIMLQQKCQLAKPWLYLSEFYEKSRDEYVQNLFNVSADANWNIWIEFCLRGTVIHARETINRCDRLLAIRETLTKRIADVDGSFSLNQIVEDIFFSPFVRVAELSRRLGVTYPKAKADLERLAHAEILRELPLASAKRTMLRKYSTWHMKSLMPASNALPPEFSCNESTLKHLLLQVGRPPFSAGPPFPLDACELDSWTHRGN